MFDIFYSGPKPNLFAHEREARDIAHARSLSRTRYFWWTNYLTDYTGFDFLFEPVPWQADQRHAWASQWQRDSGTYLIPRTGYKETNYHQDYILTRSSSLDNWTDIPADWDSSWHPDYSEPALVYQFGTQWQKTGGPRYTVPGASDVKYVDSPRYIRTEIDKQYWDDLTYESFDYTWHPDATDPALIYQFGTQWQKTGGPQYKIPGATQTKYVRTPYYNKTDQDTNWVVPANVDNASFDYTWHPDATDPPYTYQFGTQHQRTGGPQYLVPGAKDIKFVDQLRIQTNRVATAIYEIDHMDGAAGEILNITRRVRYFDNYRDTLIRLAKSIGTEHEFVWVCSSICDYSNFDFSWHPEQWQASMLHVFASDDQKFGDTFFMHVPSFAYRAERVELLEWYDCNFVPNNRVPRRAWSKIAYTADSVVDVIKNHEFHQPVAQFYRHTICDVPPTINLWRNSTKTVIALSADNSTIIVPREIKNYIQQQGYDYPYIDKTCRSLIKPKLQDIVFISYDEPDAEQNWQTLVERFPRAQRVHGVKGMEMALEAAADLAQTPWYFAVFAKTRLYEQFDFSFVPDYMQQPKHYIFNARNTVNGLEYGHMGIIMYNSQGIRKVNQTKDFGVDYTLSFAHESIPILSCYGEFDQTPYHTWRTAFREASKLAYFEYERPTVDGAYRLNIWQTQASGPYAEWCLRGANDGVEFFKNSDRQLSTIKQAFRWEWLRDYFVTRYGNLE